MGRRRLQPRQSQRYGYEMTFSADDPKFLVKWVEDGEHHEKTFDV